MLRAAMAVVIGGCAFGGPGTLIGHRQADHDVSHAISHVVVSDAAGHAGTATVAMKTVVFHGYAFDVPARWPVYRLDGHPDQCVRYDIHAVYLGSPGDSQRCPAGLVGRTETVSIGDAAEADMAPAMIGQRAAVRGEPAGSGRAGAPERAWTTERAGTAERAGAPRVVFQDAKQQELGIPMPASAPAITATYGTDPALVKRILASVRQITPQSAPLGKASGEPSAGAAPTAPGNTPTPPVWTPTPTPPVMTPTAPVRVPSAPTRTPSFTKPTPQASPSARGRGPQAALADTASPRASVSPGTQPSAALTLSRGRQAGFDTCTAPSLQAMRAWRAKFSATAVYIGGQEMACGYGNLSANWIHQVRALGWSLMPTYVGPQAPCDDFSVKVDPKNAAAQGRQNAQWAVKDAAMFGIGKGSPIYYDMEAYPNAKQRCVAAVLTFLDAWTRQLNDEGYLSGVYSSAGSGVVDLVNNTKVAGHSLAEPQAIWFALWDNTNDLDGSPYLPRGKWPALHRSKQFAGSHWMTIGHITLDIDSDVVNSAVAR